MDANTAESNASRQLTDRELERISRNKERARALRSSRIVRPYPTKTAPAVPVEKQDTCGGFLLDDNDIESPASTRVAQDPVLVLGDEQPSCHECKSQLAESYLLTHFCYPVCDSCRDGDGKHSMIARTTAKEEFLLKDVDLDDRPTPLPFLLRRNPHARFGEMKLYLKCQVEERAISIWDSLEAIEEEKKKKQDTRVERKQKKLNKDLKALHKTVLSKTRDRAPHQHVYPASSEVYNEEDDTYTKTCATCGYSVTFEKM
eukprot:scpid79902/ scgid4862/ DNA repair protein complementing XP-A cells homolog; Xeroderma pigmentosum group A-complementing protein homolog